MQNTLNESDEMLEALRQLDLAKADELEVRQTQDLSARSIRDQLAEGGMLTDEQLAAAADHGDTHRTGGLAASQRFGKYDLVREIGSGGMGVVLEAVDRTLDRRVALKVLKRFGGHDEPRYQRFRREARLTAQLRHPAVVRVFEAGVIDGLPFIAMELIDGLALDRILTLARTGDAPLPDAYEPLVSDRRERVALVQRVAEAIHDAHEQGIVHRDLKPSNILVGHESDPYITDFGLAVGLDDARMTASDQVIGTPAYMSPEQAAGDLDAVDARSDVYSLGVILYRCITLHEPFDSEQLISMLGKVIHDEPPWPSERIDGVDPMLEAICLKAMSKR